MNSAPRIPHPLKHPLKAVMAAALLTFALAGCVAMGANGGKNGEGNPELPANGCYVHLFDGDNFDANDDNFVLTEPGRYADLKELPGADKDWTDEADSLIVGPNATVIGWSETNFQGTEVTYESDSRHPDVDDEPSSLELTCN